MKLLSDANMSKIRAMLLNAMPEKPGLVFAIYRHMTGNNYPISRNPEPMWETLMNNPKIYGPIMKKIVWVMCDSLSPFDYGQGIEDNPPFSIISKICRFFQANGILFFLFCPGLMLTALRKGMTLVSANCQVMYENGANVRTNFITNLSPYVALETAPGLNKALNEICENLRKEKKRKSGR